MNRGEVAEKLRAFSPDELIAAYRDGRRDFSRSNLLRAEIEATVRVTRQLDCIKHTSVNRYNPLWVDFRFSIDREFEWDQEGRCLSVGGADLPAARKLSGATLAGIILSGAYLYPIDFSYANLSRSDLRHAVFIDCILSGASLVRADLRDVQFLHCSLDGANFYMARMERVVMAGCNARRVNLRRAKLRRAHLVGIDLRDSSLQDAHCERITLAGDLRGIDLSKVRLPAARVGESMVSARQVKQLLRALAIEVK